MSGIYVPQLYGWVKRGTAEKRWTWKQLRWERHRERNATFRVKVKINASQSQTRIQAAWCMTISFSRFIPLNFPPCSFPVYLVQLFPTTELENIAIDKSCIRFFFSLIEKIMNTSHSKSAVVKRLLYRFRSSKYSSRASRWFAKLLRSASILKQLLVQVI